MKHKVKIKGKRLKWKRLEAKNEHKQGKITKQKTASVQLTNHTCGINDVSPSQSSSFDPLSATSSRGQTPSPKTPPFHDISPTGVAGAFHLEMNMLSL